LTDTFSDSVLLVESCRLEKIIAGKIMGSQFGRAAMRWDNERTADRNVSVTKFMGRIGKFEI